MKHEDNDVKKIEIFTTKQKNIHKITDIGTTETK